MQKHGFTLTILSLWVGACLLQTEETVFQTAACIFVSTTINHRSTGKIIEE